MVFVLASVILTLIFCLFCFLSDFFRNGFSNSKIVRSRSSFGWVNENFLNYTSGRVLLCFFISSSRPYDVTTTSNLLFVHSFMQFQLNYVRNVIFCSSWSEFFLFIHVIKFLVTFDLPHSQK